MSESPEKRRRTYIVLALDCSGSMWKRKQETIRGYNENIRTLLEDSDKPDSGEIFVSLLTFNMKISEVFFNAPAEILREMRDGQYQPAGGTRYYDAIYAAIKRLQETTDINDEFNSYLVIGFTDGQDTDSVRSLAELNSLKSDMENTNRWTFTTVSPSADMAKIQSDLDLSEGNTMSYDTANTAAAFATNSKQLRSYMVERSKHKSYSTKNFYK